MRKILLAAGAIGALLTVSACADTGYGYYGASAGPPDVYYDGYYGPYTDGYWGPDAAFYYRGSDGRFLRGDNEHFRHRTFEHSQGYRAHARIDRDHDGR